MQKERWTYCVVYFFIPVRQKEKRDIHVFSLLVLVAFFSAKILFSFHFWLMKFYFILYFSECRLWELLESLPVTVMKQFHSPCVTLPVCSVSSSVFINAVFFQLKIQLWMSWGVNVKKWFNECLKIKVFVWFFSLTWHLSASNQHILSLNANIDYCFVSHALGFIRKYDKIQRLKSVLGDSVGCINSICQVDSWQ